MSVISQKHMKFASYFGILILCLAVCIQLLGVQGTLLNFVDSEDDFQASVMIGYTITSGRVSLLPYLPRLVALPHKTKLNVTVFADTLFHPPVFL